jgi:hypothetical protein
MGKGGKLVLKNVNDKKISKTENFLNNNNNNNSNNNSTSIKQNRGLNCCWAKNKTTGLPCMNKKQELNAIPYCSKHLGKGDGAFSIKDHEICGKILVANFDLPKGYKSVYFGTRKPIKMLNAHRQDYMLSFWKGGGVIDPQDYLEGSKLQFMSNPGPNERSNVTCTDRMFGDTRDVGIVGREYKCTDFIPKGTQLLQFYGHNWFSARGIKLVDCGTKKYPAPLRRRNKKPLEE